MRILIAERIAEVISPIHRQLALKSCTDWVDFTIICCQDEQTQTHENSPSIPNIHISKGAEIIRHYEDYYKTRPTLALIGHPSKFRWVR